MPGAQLVNDQIERAKSLTTVVAERLRAGIIDGSIGLGSLLSEKVLAESFGVSKTPVREALVQLQAEGLVTIMPQKGGLVFEPDTHQVRELCEIRMELESVGLRLSMQRNPQQFAELLGSIVADMEECFDAGNPVPYQQLDNAFHSAFFVHCGNSLLTRAYETFSPRVCALRTHLSTPELRLLSKSLEEHRAMRNLVISGDETKALRLLRNHISRTQEVHSRAIVAATEAEFGAGTIHGRPARRVS